MDASKDNTSAASLSQNIKSALRPDAQNLDLPFPNLKHDFRLAVQLNPLIPVGQTIWGQRNWVSFASGQWAASWGSGTLVPGGQDSQLVTSDLSARLETNYLLKTSDEVPAFIVVRTNGWRTGPKDVLERLYDPESSKTVKLSDYKFRLFVSFETGDERYSFLNTGMWIGSGARFGSEVIYDGYRVG